MKSFLFSYYRNTRWKYDDFRLILTSLAIKFEIFNPKRLKTTVEAVTAVEFFLEQHCVVFRWSRFFGEIFHEWCLRMNGST